MLGSASRAAGLARARRRAAALLLRGDDRGNLGAAAIVRLRARDRIRPGGASRGIAGEKRRHRSEVVGVVGRQPADPGQPVQIDADAERASDDGTGLYLHRNPYSLKALGDCQGNHKTVLERRGSACYDPRTCRGVWSLTSDTFRGTIPQGFGPFRVLHQVGAGTLGPVFRAYDAAARAARRRQAFTLDLRTGQARRLGAALDELIGAASSIRQLRPQSPAAAGTLPWFAQAYVPAESLDPALREYGPAPIRDALGFVAHLAGALDYAASSRCRTARFIRATSSLLPTKPC